jgi:hypothetical protein
VSGGEAAGARPWLVAVELYAEPDAWRAAGFTVGEDGRCRIGTTDLVLSGGSGGFAGWTVAGAIPGEDGLDGVATRVAADDVVDPHASATHPNGVSAIDHIVLATPDTARTYETLEAAGFTLRRVRDAGTPERPLRQGFFLFSDVLLEVVGPPEPAPDTAPADSGASLWGITLVTTDLTAAAASFGAALGAPRAAVQTGREIAVVAREAGLGVRVALMTPRP